MTNLPTEITLKKYLRKKCGSCGQTTSIYENLCPKCRRPTGIDFNQGQLLEVINSRIEFLDLPQLVISKNDFIKTIFEESIGAYLENSTTITMLSRWIDHQFPTLEAEIVDLIQAQPSLQSVIQPLQHQFGEMRSKLEKARQSLQEQPQRNPVGEVYSEYSKRYYEYMVLFEKIESEEKRKLETELTHLMNRFRQIFLKIQKGQTELWAEMTRFHNSVDQIAQKAPIILRQMEEYELLDKTVKAMIRIPVD